MRTLFINIKELIQVENLPKKFVAGKEMKMLPTLKNAFLLIENDLISDFGHMENMPKTKIDRIIDVAPEVVSHNIETVRRLTREVRIQAKYDKSLGVLKYLKDQGQRRTKTGLMLGLGETRDEVIETLHDIRNADVDVVTIGQYLQPSKKHLPVKQFITPDQFKEYETIGLDLGFRHVESSALVRSSYKAQKHIN